MPKRWNWSDHTRQGWIARLFFIACSVAVIAVSIAVVLASFTFIRSSEKDQQRIERLQQVTTNQRATIDQGICYDRIEFTYESAAGEFFIIISDAIASDEANIPAVVDARQRLVAAKRDLDNATELCPDAPPLEESNP